MKSNLLIGISCMLAASIVLYACQKQISPSKAAPSLIASTTNAATGEKVALHVVNAPSGTHLVWTSNPATNTLFSAKGQGSANVSFSKPGTYKVTCYIVSGDEQDSIPTYDTTHNPYDTVPYYPPPPPYDSTQYPHDSTIYPHDTTPGNPYDTMPNYPHDTMPNYPHDTTPNYPHDTTPNYPHDTNHNPVDSTLIDSLGHATNSHVIATVTVIITVH